MFLKFTSGIVLVVVLAGCTSVRLDQKQEFVRHNPEIAKNAVELYEVPVDQWVALESSRGLGRLSSRAKVWRENEAQISDPDRREKMQRFLSKVIEESDRRYISALVGICEVKSKMAPQDRLLYCRIEGDSKAFYGHFFIVRSGKIRKEVFILPCTWGIGNEAMWFELSEEQNRK